MVSKQYEIWAIDRIHQPGVFVWPEKQGTQVCWSRSKWTPVELLFSLAKFITKEIDGDLLLDMPLFPLAQCCDTSCSTNTWKTLPGFYLAFSEPFVTDQLSSLIFSFPRCPSLLFVWKHKAEVGHEKKNLFRCWLFNTFCSLSRPIKHTLNKCDCFGH